MPSRSLLIVALAVAAAVAGCGGPGSGPDLHISGAVVRVPPGANTAAYFTVENTGGEGDRLLGVDSSNGRAEIHETVVHDGVASMRRVESGVEVPAGGQVRFEPGGLHVMLLDVPPMVEGDVVTLTLEWEVTGRVVVEAPLRANVD